MRNDSLALKSPLVDRIAEGLLVLEPTRRQYRTPTVLLSPGLLTLGSADDCTIQVPGEGVMPRHCLIECTPGRTVLMAENTRTWHNDGPVKEAELYPGDRLA